MQSVPTVLTMIVGHWPWMDRSWSCNLTNANRGHELVRRSLMINTETYDVVCFNNAIRIKSNQLIIGSFWTKQFNITSRITLHQWFQILLIQALFILLYSLFVRSTFILKFARFKIKKKHICNLWASQVEFILLMFDVI